MSNPNQGPNISLAVDAFDISAVAFETARPGSVPDMLDSPYTASRVSSLFVPQRAILDAHTMIGFSPFFNGHSEEDQSGKVNRKPSYPVVFDTSLSGAPRDMEEYIDYILRRYPARVTYFTLAPDVPDTAIRYVISRTRANFSTLDSRRPREIGFLLTGVLPEDKPEEIKSIFNRSPLNFMKKTIQRAQELQLEGVVASAEFGGVHRSPDLQYIGSGVNLTGENYISAGGVEKHATPYSKAIRHCSQVVVGNYIADHPDGYEVALKSLQS